MQRDDPTYSPGSPAQRRRWRAALQQRWPWLVDPEVGPAAVNAGNCDRCGTESRLVEVCGPSPWEALGRRCALELGPTAWCDGHAEVAGARLQRLRDLPDDADSMARLWWVTTGEVRLSAASAHATVVELDSVLATAPQHS